MNYSRFFTSLLLSLVLLLPEMASAQTSDSLMQLLSKGRFKNDRERYDILCRIIVNSSDTVRKIQYCDEAIALAEKLKIQPSQPYVYKGIGYLDSGKLPSALECFIKAAKYYKEEGNNKGLASVYLYIVETYASLGKNSNVKYYLKLASEIYKNEKDTVNMALTLHNLGYADYTLGQYDTALILFSTTSDLFKKMGNKTQYAYCVGNSGLVYSKLSEYDKAESYLLRAIDTLNRIGEIRAVTEYMIEYATILQHKGEIKKATGYAIRAFNKAVKNDLKEYERDGAKVLAGLYQAEGRYDSAFHYQAVYIVANDSIKNIVNVQKMADLRTEFEVSKKQTEVKILEKNKLIQRIVIAGLAIILLLAIGLILLYSFNLRRSRKFAAALEERRMLLEKQSTELQEKNERIIRVNEELARLYSITNNQKEEIISSINYAERIQHALLQREDTIPNTFIVFLPKDIVSGDFYWFYENEEYLFIAAVDCTGHGVPGAFMSIIGQYALNKVIKEKSVYRTAEILDQVNVEIMETLLHHDDKAINDGMDISLIAIDKKNSMLEFSGAFSPFYIICEGNLWVYKGNKFPIGKITYDAKLHFTSQLIEIHPGDMIYLFSDGYADQIGWENGKKFMSKNVRGILSEIYTLTPEEQKSRIEKEFHDWKGDREQVDDVLFIGIRIS